MDHAARTSLHRALLPFAFYFRARRHWQPDRRAFNVRCYNISTNTISRYLGADPAAGSPDPAAWYVIQPAYMNGPIETSKVFVITATASHEGYSCSRTPRRTPSLSASASASASASSAASCSRQQRHAYDARPPFFLFSATPHIHPAEDISTVALSAQRATTPCFLWTPPLPRSARFAPLSVRGAPRPAPLRAPRPRRHPATPY